MKTIALLTNLLALTFAVFSPHTLVAGPVPEPKIEPRIINAGPPPSDAIVLFDGTNLDQWQGDKGGPAKWKLEDGAMVANKTGSIHTKQGFGDCQLHIEWATPAKVEGSDQGRGNSGVFFMEHYELQVLDSYQNKTYYHGQAGAIYKQSAPLVNASRKPGEWQTYDVIFRAPKHDAEGKVTKPATITVLHNGVLVQDHFEILGTTYNDQDPRYDKHAGKLPISLQDHGNPVRYRNIWIREL